MTVDIIILSHASTNNLFSLTQQTINSCVQSEEKIKFNIVVLEQNKERFYQNATTYHITEEFNYNRFMNKGISVTNNKYVCLCNNDLIFYQNWCSNIIAAMEKEKILSACPLCPKTQNANIINGPEVVYGYNNSQQMNGWCIILNRKLLKTIGELDEEFPFWFADNAYAEQLKAHGIKHALVRNSVVKHIRSSTLNSLPKERHNEITMGYAKKFIEKHPDNESAAFFKKHLRL